MPQVLTEQVNQVITNGGTDLFSYPNTNAASILSLQTDVTQPVPAGTATATNLLNPPQQILAQLTNFPGNVYDLSPSSVLVQFMTALLGPSGTGQLLTRQMVSRLQQAVTSTNFYDLDSFYGALFGAIRGPSGTLPTNPSTSQPVSPYTDLASPDGWDEIQAIDATYRERIIQLARAITLGATPPGMQALAEAILGVSCQVYESFRLIANPESANPGENTWSEVEGDYSTWSAVPANTTWQVLEGRVTYSGLMGNGAPCEIVIRPHKKYDSSQAGLIEQGTDTYGVLSVAEVLRPAASLVSLDTTPMGLMVEVPIAGAWADSEYWEVVHLVTPDSTTDPAYQASLAGYQAGGATPGTTYMQPNPPFSRSRGSRYSYCGDVTTMTAHAIQGGPDQDSWQVCDGQDFQTVNYPTGQQPYYHKPPKCLMPPDKADRARSSSNVATKAAPYSGPRSPVKRAS